MTRNKYHPRPKRELAYCYASGHLEFGARCKKGALPIAYVTEDDKDQFTAHARLSYDGKTWLVPGVPEAPDQIAGIDALERFRDRVIKAGVATPL